MLDFKVQRREVVGHLTDSQLELSAKMRLNFVTYVNGLGLRQQDGRPLSLLADGSGGLRDYITELLVAAAQGALDSGQDLSKIAWLKVRGSRVVELDFDAYVRTIGRMKAQPAFDGFSLETGENQLFGNAVTDKRHFTAFSSRYSTVAGALQAEESTVRAIDAMQQLANPYSTVAKHWRIRHGTRDRDTSFAVPVLLAAAAQQRGALVDFALSWERVHSGDYDLDQLFSWLKEEALQV